MSAPYPLVRNRYAFSTRFGVSRSPSRAGSSPMSARSRLMRSCICLFYICSFVAPARGQVADALYADRANLASARRAAGMWSAELARDATQFDAAWKLARVDYWLGGHLPEGERRTAYEDGIAAGQKA